MVAASLFCIVYTLHDFWKILMEYFSKVMEYYTKIVEFLSKRMTSSEILVFALVSAFSPTITKPLG